MDVRFTLCFVIWYCVIYFTVQLVPALLFESICEWLLLPFDMNSLLQTSVLSAYKVLMIIRTYGQHGRIRNRLGGKTVRTCVRAYLGSVLGNSPEKTTKAGV